MGNYSREEILQLVEEEDVEFIRLQFTDMFGVIKNIAVTSRELPRALDNRCRVGNPGRRIRSIGRSVLSFFNIWFTGGYKRSGRKDCNVIFKIIKARFDLK